MSYLKGVDVSQWQGNINFDQAAPNLDFVLIKMSGGDAGLYFDPKAAQNYEGFKPKNVVVGGYHFAGGTDPIGEAEKFNSAMSPWAEGDVPMLDWEVPHSNPPAWCDQFIDHLASKGIAGGILYMNLATLNAYDWSSPLSKWGLCLADWAVSPDANAPTNHVYVMQQYSDSGTIPGIPTKVDLDAFFGSKEQLTAYGYKAPQPTPAPAPPPAPSPEPVPPAPATPPVAPVPEAPAPPAVPDPPEVKPPVQTPPVVVGPKKLTLFQRIVAFLKLIFIGKDK